MPNLYCIRKGTEFSTIAAKFIRATMGEEPLSRALILVPSRRSVGFLREAFLRDLAGKPTLLPKFLALTDITQTWGSLVEDAQALSLPRAMDEPQYRYILARQVMEFEQSRGHHCALGQALVLGDQLAALHEQMIRIEMQPSMSALLALTKQNYAEHWRQALAFLAIITDSWPPIEAALGAVAPAKREVMALTKLTTYWTAHPPSMHVFAVGSTASQLATRRLLKTIAELSHGHVILPGLEPSISPELWDHVAASHPLFHIKTFLNQWPVEPREVIALDPDNSPSLWLDVLSPPEVIPDWRRASPCMSSLSSLPKMIACAHVEEEARVVTLLVREALETPNKRVALITPDEGFLSRVAIMMRCYGVHVNRTQTDTLAQTPAGQLWSVLAAVLVEPDLALLIRELLHQPALVIERRLLEALEPGWRGVNRMRSGEMPFAAEAVRAHPQFIQVETLVRGIAALAKREMPACAWIAACRELLSPLLSQSANDNEALNEQFAQLSHADEFGNLDARDFRDLLSERLANPWRALDVNSHPLIFFLTPVEARLGEYDRVILASMHEAVWPGNIPANPWLNRGLRMSLGLPLPEEHHSLIAHDILMLTGASEVFFTYAKRDSLGPTMPSRYLERWLAWLEMRGISKSRVVANEYVTWANAWMASPEFTPEIPQMPMPAAHMRPRALSVSDVEMLCHDPYRVYAKLVLGLRPLIAPDESPSAKDFGIITHRALEALTQHWNEFSNAATDAELLAIAQCELRGFSKRPAIELFWKERLLRALTCVNQWESVRRHTCARAQSEQFISVALEGTEIHGRIDRLEVAKDTVSVIDYKTGELASVKEVEEGRVLQLPLYGLLYALLHPECAHMAIGLEYWQMPSKQAQEGMQRRWMLAPEDRQRLYDDINALLLQMQDETTPFLVGVNKNCRSPDYDGISRVQEWAAMS